MDTIPGRLNQIDYKKIVWVLAISETIHNLEEAIWLPASLQVPGVWHPEVGAFEFRFATTLLTLLFYGVIYYFSVYDHTLAKYLMGGMLVMILFNVFVPHLAGTILTAQYAPGVISGVLLNIPVCLYLLWRGLNEGIYKTRTLILSGLAFTLIVAPLVLAFFALGKVFEVIL